MSKTRVESVKKALDILDILVFEDAEHDGVTLTELSKRTGIKPNTLHAILKTMQGSGYVEQNAKLRYMSGKRCRQISLISHNRLSAEDMSVLDNVLMELRDEVDESVSFYMLDRGERINYTNIANDKSRKAESTMLEEKSMYWYPSGRILCAYCSEKELSRIIRRNGYPGEWWDNIETKEQLVIALECIRARGYEKLYSDSDSRASYSIPTFSSDGKLIGALGVYMPLEHKSDEKETLTFSAMKECAEKIKAEI